MYGNYREDGWTTVSYRWGRFRRGRDPATVHLITVSDTAMTLKGSGQPTRPFYRVTDAGTATPNATNMCNMAIGHNFLYQGAEWHFPQRNIRYLTRNTRRDTHKVKEDLNGAEKTHSP
ncbi:hypothetical protein PAMP_002037 [Pampus punctatissimus]